MFGGRPGRSELHDFQKPFQKVLALAEVTKFILQSVKLGTICLASFPLRHPVLLAIQWTSLDVLPEGRTILAVCSGGSERNGSIFATNLQSMGVKSGERVGRVVEGIDFLRRLWEEERVTHEGKDYQFSDVEMLPKPWQRPLPIYLGDYSIREGWDISGWPVTTLLRGKVMVENGQFFGDQNDGQFIPRRIARTFSANWLARPGLMLCTSPKCHDS